MMDPLHKYPLLYQLFLRLQQYDRYLGHRALGVKEYYALMEALNKGVGLSDEVHFKKIVHWMWRKPHHDKNSFDQILNEGLELVFAELKPPKDAKLPSTTTPGGPSSKGQTKTQKLEKEEAESSSASHQAKQPSTTIGEESPTEEEGTLIISFERANPDKDDKGLKLDIETVSAEINKHHYLLEGNYFELGTRQLQQGIRTMRRRMVDKTKKVIDLEGTIQKASRQGFLESLEFRQGATWTTDLLILVDQGFSMIAFQPFAEQLVAIIDEDYDIQDVVYFFQKAPHKYLFLDSAHKETVPIEEIEEARLQSVLIISDGGASTGRIDEERVEHTVAFLARIRKHRVAWLNPMPRDRWINTSAEYIAQFTNMFFLEPTELVNVVKLFKAKLKGDSLLERYVQENY